MEKKKDNNYYVYIHRKKTNGEVFYVGKGKGKRAWATSKTVSRSKLWRNTSAKHGLTVEIVVNDIQEWYAFELECELILRYGRIDNGTGCLVNHTDGGDGTSGWIPSKKYRKNLSDRVSGANHPLHDDTIYSFVNINTNNSFKGTRYEFNTHFGLRFHQTRNLNTIKPCSGWIIEGTLTSDEIEAILCKFSGKYSLNAFLDKNEYSFTNLITLEAIKCKRYEFEEKYNIRIGSIFGKSANKRIYDWCLTETLNGTDAYSLLNHNSGLGNGRSDKNEYSFTNVLTGDVFLGTRNDIESVHSINVSSLFSNKTGGKSYKGWVITGTDIQSLRIDFNIYNLIHTSGELFSGRRSDFKEKYGFHIKPLFSKIPAGICKGWSLAK